MKPFLVPLCASLLGSCATLAPAPGYDLLIRNGTIVDGRGGAPFVGDVAIRGEAIVAVAPSISGTATRTIDARGLTVTPGFINVLSWDRGSLAAGMKADVAIFDAATIADRATFDRPQQFAVGMRHVLVNGQAVLSDGDMTAARPGQAVRGPGYRRCPPRP